MSYAILVSTLHKRYSDIGQGTVARPWAEFLKKRLYIKAPKKLSVSSKMP